MELPPSLRQPLRAVDRAANPSRRRTDQRVARYDIPAWHAQASPPSSPSVCPSRPPRASSVLPSTRASELLKASVAAGGRAALKMGRYAAKFQNILGRLHFISLAFIVLIPSSPRMHETADMLECSLNQLPLVVTETEK